MTVRSSGVGSMPVAAAADYAEVVNVAFGEVDLPFLPEVPSRGPGADVIGRTLGMMTEFGVDLQPHGWRIGVGGGIDQRRTRSYLAQDLDAAEQWTQQHAGDDDRSLKIAVAGPLTLAAAVELPRGEKVLSDHGALRELAQAVALAAARHLVDVQHRLDTSVLWVQIDEPSAPAVLAGRVPTASRYSRYRSVSLPTAVDVLSPVVAAISEAGARSVMHSCAADFPLELATQVPINALSFDFALAKPSDSWGAAFESGIDLWPGTSTSTAEDVRQFFAALGFGPEKFADRLVVTPACGLAAMTVAQARQQLVTVGRLARELRD